MKFLKNTIVIVALWTIGFISAKQMIRTTKTPQTTAPKSTEPTELEGTIPSQKQPETTEISGAPEELSAAEKLSKSLNNYFNRVSAANGIFRRALLTQIRSSNLDQKTKNELFTQAAEKYEWLSQLFKHSANRMNSRKQEIKEPSTGAES